MPPRSRAGSRSRSKSPRRSASKGRKGRSSSPSPVSSQEPLNPRTKVYEWGGPAGAVVMVILLPAIVLALNTLCNETTCSVQKYSTLHWDILKSITQTIPQLPMAICMEVAWLLFHAVLYVIPVGKRIQGLVLRDGTTLTYHINAVYVFVLTHAIVGGLHYMGIIRLAILAEMFTPLMIASIIISTGMSFALYVASFRSSSVLLARGGNSGNPFYDFWIGRELNPRTGSLDWKFMCELRPGLIGWSILNWAFVAKSLESGTCSPAIVVIALLESFYVFDGLLIESGVLTMMDIVHDGFGFMLCFGDLAWVPFTYTLKTKFLAYHAVKLSNVYVAFCALIAIAGYIIFRASNNQKNAFRRNPKDSSVSKLKVLRTSQGRSLLVSGYWGVCRHPNYVGDWLITLSWSLLTGVGAVLPYYQPVYFAFLLIHRQLRDEEQMREKYGEEDWKKFCGIVRYRLIPFVY